MNKKFLIVCVILMAALVAYLVWIKIIKIDNRKIDDRSLTATTTAVILDKNTRYLKIPEGTTFGEYMTEQGLDANLTASLYEAAKDIYDLSIIKPGRRLDLKYNESELISFKYDIDDQSILVIEKNSGLWQANKKAIDYVIEQKVATGSVTSSLYEAGLSAGLDEGLIIELADAFGWTIDFAMDVREGDTFKVLYEARQRDGQQAKPGRVLAAQYINAGTSYELYLWTDKNGKDVYYDDQGRAAPKKFLRAPVSFRYISSGYSANPRYVGGQFQRFTSNHLAIDYAATYGVPIRAVGDGTISFAGWKSGYGNVVIIRHDGIYSTLYGHMSKILVRNGQRISQGGTIGKVGSTGFSTGPHVHYEMMKSGVKVNPLKEVQPPSAPLGAADMSIFVKLRDEYKGKMGN